MKLKGNVAGAVAVLVEAIDGAEHNALTVANNGSAAILCIAKRAVTHLDNTRLGVALAVPRHISRKGIARSGRIGIAGRCAGIKHSHKVLYLKVGHQRHVAVYCQLTRCRSIVVLVFIGP